MFSLILEEWSMLDLSGINNAKLILKAVLIVCCTFLRRFSFAKISAFFLTTAMGAILKLVFYGSERNSYGFIMG